MPNDVRHSTNYTVTELLRLLRTERVNVVAYLMAIWGAAAIIAYLLAPQAHADPPPPPPDQCRTINAMTLCRHSDGTATVCGALTGCQPAYNVPPGFFEGGQP